VKEPDAHGEDHVEAPVTEVERLELGDEELRPARRDVLRVAAGGGLDHLRRAVDGREAARVEALADVGGGDAVAAPDLQDPRRRREAQSLDDGEEAVGHDGDHGDRVSHDTQGARPPSDHRGMDDGPRDLYDTLDPDRGAELRRRNQARLAELEASSVERRARLAMLRALMSPDADVV
jgi:hypothetical protein